MVDLQCQGLSKCVNAVRGARRELVSEIAGVENPRMALDAAQARLLGKLLRDPTALGDMWSGPGGKYTQQKRKRGRTGRDNVESDGLTSVMSAIPNKAVVIGDGDEGLSVGGRVEKEEIPEMRLQANKDSKADRWSWQYAKPGKSRSEFSQMGT